MLDGKYHAASRRSVKLGKNDARNLGNLLELPCLIDGILSRSRIEYQKHLAVRIRKLAVDNTVNLCKLLHKIFLVMKSACGVDNNDIGVSRLGGIYRIKYDCGRVSALGVLYYINTRAVGPDLKLVNCRRTEGVGSA